MVDCLTKYGYKILQNIHVPLKKKKHGACPKKSKTKHSDTVSLRVQKADCTKR